MTLKTALRVGAAVAFSAAIVTLLLYNLDLEKAAALWKTAAIEWLFLAAALTVGLVFVRGLRFARVEPKPGVIKASAAIGVQTLINRLAPMRLGELSLPLLLRRYASTDTARSLLVLILIRIIELALTIALLIGSVLAIGSLGETRWIVVLVLFVAVGVVGLVFFRQLVLALLKLGQAIVRISGLDRFAVFGKTFESLRKAAGGSAKLSTRGKIEIFALSLSALLIQVAVFGCILEAFNLWVGVLPLLAASCLVFVGSVIPLPTVGSIGTLEASWVIGFSWVGMATPEAVSTAIAAQVITLSITAVAALPCWLILRRGLENESP